MYKGTRLKHGIQYQYLIRAEHPISLNYCSSVKPCAAACCQVEGAAERLGDSGPNPHGCEDDLFTRLAAVLLKNTSADITADLRDHFTLLLLSPLSRYRTSSSFPLAPSRYWSPVVPSAQTPSF